MPSVLEEAFGAAFRSVAGREEIEQILADAGPGARGIVYGFRGPGMLAHFFNAANQGGAINFIDFQIGGEASFEGYNGFQFLLTSGGG
jgi:hypothetical protein